MENDLLGGERSYLFYRQSRFSTQEITKELQKKQFFKLTRTSHIFCLIKFVTQSLFLSIHESQTISKYLEVFSNH